MILRSAVHTWQIGDTGVTYGYVSYDPVGSAYDYD